MSRWFFFLPAAFLALGSSAAFGQTSPSFAVSAADAAVEEGDAVYFNVRLSAADLTADATVDWAIGGTVSAGDYDSPAAGSFTFTPANWAAQQTVRVLLLDDGVHEAAETLTLTLSNPSVGTVATATASVTIAASDPVTAHLAFTGADVDTAAAGPQINPGDVTEFTVTLSGATSLAAPASVSYTAQGGTPAGGNVAFPIGAPTPQRIAVAPNPAATMLTVTVGTGAAAESVTVAVAATALANLTVVSIADSPVTEEGGTALFPLAFSGDAPSGDVNVAFHLGAAAGRGPGMDGVTAAEFAYIADTGAPATGQPLRQARTYTAAQVAAAMSGATPLSIGIGIADDGDFAEGDEVMRVTLVPGPQYTHAAGGPARISRTAASAAADNLRIASGRRGYGLVTVPDRRLRAAIVRESAAGVAEGGTVNFRVKLVRVSDGSDQAIWPGQATFNRLRIAVEGSADWRSVSSTAAAGEVEFPDTANRVYRFGVDVNEAQVLRLWFDVDTPASGVAVPVRITDDAVNEGDETLRLRLIGAVLERDYLLVPPDIAAATAAVTIAASDAAVIAIAAPGADADEDAIGAALTFTASLQTAAGGALTADAPVTVTYAVTGAGAIPGEDFADPGGGSVTIAANAAGAAITLPLAADHKREARQGVTVTATAVSGGSGAVALPEAGAAATGHIAASDQSRVGIVASAAALAGTEEGASATFTVSVGVAQQSNLDIAYTVAAAAVGAAADAADFAGGTFPSGTVTLAAGQTSADFAIAIAGDDTAEPREFYTVTLSDGAAYDLSDEFAATANIAPGDAGVVTLAADSSAAAAEGSAATFTVTVSPAPGADVMIPWSVAGSGDNPASAADFGDGSSENFPGGMATVGTSGTAAIAVPIHDDTAEEAADESYTVTLGSNITGGGAMSYQLDSAAAGVTAAIAAGDYARRSVTITGGSQTAEGEAAAFTVAIAPPPLGEVALNWQVTATAATGDDETEAADFGDGAAADLPSGTLAIPAGQGSTALGIPTRDDAADEAEEFFTLTATVAESDPATYAAPAAVNGSIAASDNVMISVRVEGPGVVEEGGTANFRLVFATVGGAPNGGIAVTYRLADAPGSSGFTAADLSGAPLEFTLDFNQSAVASGSQDVSFQVVDDDVVSAACRRGSPPVDRPGALPDTPGVNGDLCFQEAAERVRMTLIAAAAVHPADTARIAGAHADLTIPDRRLRVAVTLDSNAGGGAVDEGVAEFSMRVQLVRVSDGRPRQLWHPGDTATVELFLRAHAAEWMGGNNDADFDQRFFCDRTDEFDDPVLPGQCGSGGGTVSILSSGDTLDDPEMINLVFTEDTPADGFELRFFPNDDNRNEADSEGVSLTVHQVEDNVFLQRNNARGQVLNGDPAFRRNAARVDLRDNDPAEARFAVVTAEVDEDIGGALEFRATLHRRGGSGTILAGADTAVTFTLGGTAAGGAATDAMRDYTAPDPAQITIPAGQSSATLRLPVVDDARREERESVVLTPVDIVAAAGGGSVTVDTTAATAHIAASDQAILVSIAAPDNAAPAAAEGGSASFTVTAGVESGALAHALTVAWSVTAGTAAAADFGGALPGGTVTIPAGRDSADFSVAITDDNFAEPRETFGVALGAITKAAGDTENYRLHPAAGTVAAAIAASDPVLVSLGDATAEESDGSARLPLNLSGGTLPAGVSHTVTFTIAQVPIASTAGFGNDYTVSGTHTRTIAAAGATGLIFTITDDNLSEAAETAAWRLAGITGGGGVVALAGGAPEDQERNGVLTIAASDPLTVSLDFLNMPGRSAAVNEGCVPSSCRQVQMRLNLSGGVPSRAVTVEVQATGSAELQQRRTGGDYSFFSPDIYEGNTVTRSINAGTTGANVVMRVLSDNLNEEDETFTVSIGSLRVDAGGGSVSVDPAASALTVTIADDDMAGVTVTRTSAAATVSEGGFAVFQVRGIRRPLPIAVGGDGITAGDYNIGFPTDGRIGDGGTIRINLIADGRNEGAETLAVTVAGASASVAVAASDPLTAAIAAGASTAAEGDTAAFTVTLSGATNGSAAAVTVPYTIGGDVAAGDYTDPGGGSLTIAPGATSGAINIFIRRDAGMESAEDLTVTLTADDPGTAATDEGPTASDGGGAVAVTTAAAERSATVSIAANSAAAASFVVDAPADVTIDEGGTAVFTVTLLAQPSADATVAWAVGGVDSGDYSTADSSPLTFTTGNWQTAQMVTLALTDDSVSEAAEQLTFTLSSPTSATLATASASVTVNPSDPVTYAISADRSVAEGATATFTVTLGGEATAGAVSVPFTVTADSAAASDYSVTAASPLMFASGSGSMDIVVATVADDLAESSETVTVTLGAPTSASHFTAGATAATLTITDDDAITVSIARKSGESGAVMEGGQARFTVTLSKEPTATVTVPVTASGTLTLSDTQLQFAAGETEKDVTATVTDDDLLERGENFAVILGAPRSAAGRVSGSGVVHVQVADDDMATVTIARAAGDTDFSEAGAGASSSRNALFTVTVAGARLVADARIGFRIGGEVTPDMGATLGDFRSDTTPLQSAGLAIPPAGGTTATGTIAIRSRKDALNEGDEDLTVTLISAATAVGSIALGAGNSATAILVDDDPLSAAIARRAGDSGAVAEGDAAHFTVTLSGPDGAVSVEDAELRYTIAGIAAADIDADSLSGTVTVPAGRASADFTIAAAADNLNESAETMTVTLDASGHTAAGIIARSTLTAEQSAQATIADDDPITVTIARQGAASADENDSVAFRVALGGGLRTADVIVPFAFGGTLSNSEYEITAPSGIAATATGGTIAFDLSGTPTATDTADITVNLQGDSVNEATETLVITGTAASPSGLRTAAGAIGYGTGGNTDTAAITDDDAITYSIADAAAVTEGDSGDAAASMTFTVSLSGASAGNVTIPYSLGGTATGGGADYTDPNPLSVTISAGQSSADIGIAIVHDNMNEGGETIAVTLGATPTVASGGGSVTRASAMGDYTASGTINDDDGVAVALSGGGDVNEGSSAAVTVTLGAEATGSVTVNYTIGNTSATGDNDAEIADDLINTSGGSITIDTSSTRTGTIAIAAAADNLNEGDETFTVSVATGGTDLPGSVSISGSPRTFTIKDDANDAISVTIARTSAAAAGEDADATFSVTLGGGVRTADVVAPFSVTGLANEEFAITGPATAPAATATTHTATFGIDGSQTATDSMNIAIDLQGDNLNEATETLAVTGAAPGASGLRTAGSIGYAANGDRDTVSVTDDDAITVTLADSADIEEGGTAEFAVTLDRASATAVTVRYTVTAGGANPPPFTDAGNGSISIAQGQQSGAIRIASDGTDAINSGSGTLTVRLASHTAAGAISGSGAQSATVTYREFDRNFSVAVDTGSGKTADRDSTADGVQVNEGDTIYFRVSLAGTAPASGDDATVMWAPSGATADTADSGATLTFTDGNWSTAQEVTVTVTADGVNEGAETIGVTLGGASGGGGLGTGIAAASASVTIAASDPITYAIGSDSSAAEGDSGGTAGIIALSVTLSGASAGSAWDRIRVPFSIDGNSTATAATDYAVNPANGMLVFEDLDATPTLTGVITVTAVGDDLNEVNETVIINLGTPAAMGGSGGGTVMRTATAADHSATATIADDDAIAATFAGASAAVSINEGETATLTVE
ncbi:MAG: hypothetical protein OXU61_07715, partial [Gammaproteobacteria bacterium]|nr:hypothetical protein [Gammaproteobacteria bacterium]